MNYIKYIKPKRFVAVALSVTLAVCSLSGCVFLPDEEEVLAAPSVSEANISYSTVTAKRRDLVKRDVNTATIYSESEYKLSFKNQSGTITKIYVHAGDEVKKGDIICELDTSSLDYSITETELRLKKAQLDKKVLKEQGASQAEIDRAQVEIDLIQLQLDDLYEKQEDAKLYAVADGTVSSLGSGVSAGNYIDAGATVATVIDTSKVYMAIAPSSSENYKLYKIGTELFIEIGDVYYDAEVFMTPSDVIAQTFEEEEVIYDIYDPDAEEQEEAPTGIVYDREHIYIRFKDTPPEDCVGNLADAVLIIDESKDAIVISNNLIKTIDDKSIVYLYKDGKKVAQEVEIGLQTGSMSEIVSGVEEGDLVIVR